jgi:hypothetical protein
MRTASAPGVTPATQREAGPLCEAGSEPATPWSTKSTSTSALPVPVSAAERVARIV